MDGDPDACNDDGPETKGPAMLAMLRATMRDVPPCVWCWWTAGATTTWSLPWMPANTTRDFCLLVATVLVVLGIRAVYAVPSGRGS